MKNPLDSVWTWYQYATDCTRVSNRVLINNVPKVVSKKHIFSGVSQEQALEGIKQTQAELDNWVVVAMVAVFERTLRDHILGHVKAVLAADDDFAKVVRQEVLKDVEYWHISVRVIDEVFAGKVSGDLRGMVKQIINHRNEVSHGHFREAPPPAFAAPLTIFRKLSEFLKVAGILKP